MLTAASTLNLAGNRVIGFTAENTDDDTYTIRDETNGLNMDFMTYSMYSLAGKDPSALVDPATFTKYASQTFSTFFQHFASNNISLSTGSWAYQPIKSIGILGCLILTIAVVALFQRRFLGRMMRNVESMGDMLVLIAGSENLIRVVREIQTGQMSTRDTGDLRTILGWFLDRNGEARWGIELERQILDGPEVEWGDGPQGQKLEDHVTARPK